MSFRQALHNIDTVHITWDKPCSLWSISSYINLTLGKTMLVELELNRASGVNRVLGLDRVILMTIPCFLEDLPPWIFRPRY